MILEKPNLSDLSIIKKILYFWADAKLAEKYLVRIKNEINGITEFNTHFWVIKNDQKTIGLIGISDLVPKTQPFSLGKNPIELRIFHLDNRYRSLGFGKKSLLELEKIIQKNNHD